MVKKKDPKVGTGKKPKGSGRRLYTDENPKDTVGIKFKTMADAKATVNKVKRIKKPFPSHDLFFLAFLICSLPALKIFATDVFPITFALCSPTVKIWIFLANGLKKIG